MNEPRNVTPGQGAGRDEWGDWSRWSWVGRGRGFPWLGVLLVLVGGGLLVQYFVPQISAWTLVLSAIGIAFMLGWLIGGSRPAVIPGLLLLALAAARLIDELGGYSGSGTTALALATAFLLIWVIYSASGSRITWPLWGVAVFGLIGFVQVSGRLVDVPAFGALWPLIIIGIGVLILLGARRRPPPPLNRS